MKIQSFERVVYRNDPLAEVVCQLRFERMDELDGAQEAAFLAELVALGYVKALPPKVQFQVNLNFVKEESDPVPPNTRRVLKAHQNAIADGSLYVGWNAESLSIACTTYPGWDHFRGRFIEVAFIYRKYFPQAKLLRVGLRYKDLIKREAIGLADRPWHALVQPFLLGPLSSGAFADNEAIPVSDVVSALTQAIVKLDDCMLVIQSALLREKERQTATAFLIDSDFFIESDGLSKLLETPAVLSEKLDVLHQQAGAMFKRGITDELHRALGPK